MDTELPIRKNPTSSGWKSVIHSSSCYLWDPQGTVFGPLLFLLYINDLPSKVNFTSRLFAVDSLLYLKISSVSDAIALQKDLDRLQQWEHNWQMSFNPSKCEVVRMTKRRNPANANYQIHGHDHMQNWKIPGCLHLWGFVMETPGGCQCQESKQ